jgi:hypothetical protein
MLPEGYTTVTISEEITGRPAELVARNDLESMADAIEYAADQAREPETLSTAELARLLYHRLADAS